MKSTELKWQGEPISVRFGYSMIKENKEKPLWWYNFECATKENLNGFYVPSYGLTGLACIPSIEITQGNQTFVIANHFGIGWNKLTKGGWPNCQHFSLTDGEFSEDKDFAIKYFDEESFAKHESERNKWQKENYPIEWQKMENLKNAFKQSIKPRTTN